MVGPDGWQVFPHDPRALRWSVEADRVADGVLSDPANDHWFRHQRSWFVGVDAVPNGGDGALNGVLLEGPWEVEGPWHRAQLSVVYQGYPGRDPNESEAAHRFRRDRCAAHLDGVLPVGPERRRHLREPHAFVLGLALNEVAEGAAPLVIWRRS